MFLQASAKALKAAQQLSSLASGTASKHRPISLQRAVRCLSATAVVGSGAVGVNVFDRETKRRQRNRAAIADDAHTYDYLRDEVASHVVDRVCDISRYFPQALDVGCGRGHVAKQLDSDVIGTLHQCDMAEKAVLTSHSAVGVATHRVVADEERLPFVDGSFDLATSCLSLHWVNNLPLALAEVCRVLRPDSPLIGAMFAGDTLFELRCSLQLAETEREGGFSPRISPFVDMRDMGALLTSAGYSLTTVDTDEVVVRYPSMYELVSDLRAMGESNASWNRRGFLRRDTLHCAAAIYREMYGNGDGSIPATFQLLYFIGWKPDQSQARPARRGSASKSFKDLSETVLENAKNLRPE